MKDILIIVSITVAIATLMVIKTAYRVIKSLNNEVNKKYTNRNN